MEPFKCKTCGTALEALAAQSKNELVECPSCFNVWTIPRKETSPAAIAFLRMGEHELDTGRFDDAFSAYQKAAELAPEESEAYFGMALAAFRVQYLKDEAKEPPRMQPICYEISGKSFSADANYLHAVELAGREKKRVYRERASEIDEIRDQFFAFQESGIRYDCFLCAKVTDGNGGTTQDSHEALKLYHHLKNWGYSPFYSEEEAKTRAGNDYEALILYALYTSECMLVVSLDETYLQTKWVKNEYSRFLQFIESAEKEGDALAVVFRGSPIERLPGKSGKLQGIDLGKPDAYVLIEEFVEAHTPAAKRRRKEEERRKREEQEERDRAFEEMKKRLRELEEERAHGIDLRKGRGKFGKCSLCGGDMQPNDELTLAQCSSCGERVPIGEAFSPEYIRALEKSRAEREERKRRLEEEQRNCFEIENGVLVKYNGKGEEAVVPEGVTEIGDHSFWGSNCSSLLRLKIPSSVEKISSVAFLHCYSLAVVTLPKRFKWQVGSLFFGMDKIIHFIYTK